jgi:hypothetical protein
MNGASSGAPFSHLCTPISQASAGTIADAARTIAQCHLVFFKREHFEALMFD